jgi:NRDE-2, necessary for RNA interference
MSSVPKFASFKPKSKLIPAPNSGDESINTGRKRPSESTVDFREKRVDRESEKAENLRHRRHHEQGHYEESDKERNDRHGRHHERDRHEEHRERRHKESDPRKTHCRSRSRRRHGAESRVSKITPVTVSGPDTEETALYIIDTKGDHQNLVYGGLHRYSIPTYHRAGAGKVLGLAGLSKIDRNESDEKGLVIHERFNGPTKREKNAFSKMEKKGIKKLRIKSPEEVSNTEDAQADFLPWREPRRTKHERGEGDGSAQEGDVIDSHYRSIEGKAKTNGPDDRDLEYATESDSDFESVGAMDKDARDRNVELSRRTQSHPLDPTAWIEFAEHQETLIVLGTKKRNTTSAERRSTAEIKISILEKGLENITGSSPGREALLLHLMEEGAKVWDYQKQSTKWKKVLDENTTYIGLWTKYINFQQTNFLSFRYEEGLTIFTGCLKVLNIARNKTRSHEEDREIEETLIYVVLRATLFMREAGFSEHGLAIWQALLEFNTTKPTKLGTAPTDIEKAQEHFWDSEVARIGEEGAKSWGHYVDQGETGPELMPKSITVRTAGIDDNDLFGSWCNAENERSRTARTPARTIDETEEDDPYRVILFSDVKDFMFRIETSHNALVDAFLAFCRLPPLPSTRRISSDGWWLDPFVRNDMLDHDNDYVSRSFFPVESSSEKQKALPGLEGMEPEIHHNGIGNGLLQMKYNNFTASQDTLFSLGDDWFSYHVLYSAAYLGNKCPVEESLVRRALRQLVERNVGGDELAEYYLSFEYQGLNENTIKVAKSILKTRTEASFRLYAAVAMMHIQSHDPKIVDKGNDIFKKMIALGRNYNLPDVLSKDNSDESIRHREGRKHETILLWKAWVWDSIRLRNYQEAYEKLLSIPEWSRHQPGVVASVGSPGNTALFLKARNHLSESTDLTASLRLLHLSAIYIELQALLVYFHKCFSVEAFLDTHHQGTILLASKSEYMRDVSSPIIGTVPHELLLQSKARLLYTHANSGRAFKPSIIREELGNAIRLFPTNSIFLGLYAWNEARFRLDDRVRTVLRDVVLRDKIDSITSWFFSIRQELTPSPATGTYNTHAVRDVFEHATNSDSGRYSISLWKLYYLFELRENGERAKQVFYRGMRSCPWSKGFLILAFAKQSPFTDDEKRKIYNVIGEKDLRIHVDLDEILEDLDERAIEEREKMLLDLPEDQESDGMEEVANTKQRRKVAHR